MSGTVSRKLSLVCLCLALSWLGTSCSSSKRSSGGGGTGSGLQFTSPTTSPTVEVANPAETVTVSVNQSVTWSLLSGCGEGKPVGTLSNETSTTATYTAPLSGTVATQICSPWQDLIVATTSSNETASLAVVVVQTPPGITNVSANTFTGELCTYGASPCCPVGSVTCCPPPSTTTVIQPGSFAGAFGITQVGVFTDIGPVNASGGVPPYTWQMSSGSLPAGLVLAPGTTSATMSFTGTPTTPGCSTFAMQITDANGVASPQGPFTFNFVVIPPSLKLSVPSYPAAYNDGSQGGDPGQIYPPQTLTASGGTAPYAWVQDPGNFGYTLPAGLGLTASTSNMVTIQGTPNAGANSSFNAAGAGAGLYPAKVQVNDSQLPYPAVGLASLGSMTDLALPQPCSQANQAVPLQPQGVSNNGGISGGGAVNADSYLQGSMAFLLRGFDTNGPVVIAGSVAVDGNGGVTGGEEDVTRSSGTLHVVISPTSSNPASYYVVGTVSIGPGQVGSVYPAYSRGCMTLATPTGATTFAFTLGGCSNHWTEHHLTTTNDNACGMTQNSQGNNIAAGTYTAGRIIEFDDCTPGSASYCTGSTRATGILRAQDSSSFSSGPSGPYAFGLSGWDDAAAHYAIAGSFQASGGNISSAAADINDGGNVSSSQTGGSGSYSSLDGYGNATGSLKIGTTSLPVSLYMVSQSEALVTTNPASSGLVLSGEAVSTGSSFSNASLQNAQIFHIGGVSPAGPDVSVGVLSFDGVSAVSGTVYEDQAGTLGTTAVSAAYQIDVTTGRVNFLTNVQGQTLGAHPFVAYVIPLPINLTRQSCSAPANCIAGFLVGTDSTAQDGILEFQTPTTGPPPPFTNVFIAGDYAYGADELLDQLSPAFEGVVYAQPSGASTSSGSLGPNPAVNQSFVRDVSYGCGAVPPQPSCILLPSQSLNGSYSVNSNGTGTFGGETVSVTNGNVTFYIDESPTNLHPSIVVVEQ